MQIEQPGLAGLPITYMPNGWQAPLLIPHNGSLYNCDFRGNFILLQVPGLNPTGWGQHHQYMANSSINSNNLHQVVGGVNITLLETKK